MKKISLIVLILFGFVVYLHSQLDKHIVTAPPISTRSNNTPAVKLKNGTFNGSSEDAFYGNVQVSITVSGGKITDVSFLDYPHDRGTSVEINSQAMPLLKQEAIQAQSANVDIISGATQTSNAFISSLSTALSKAKN